MTPSFLVQPTHAHKMRQRGLKELAMFGLRKAFVDPAPRPQKPKNRMEGFLGDESGAMDFWLPE